MIKFLKQLLCRHEWKKKIVNQYDPLVGMNITLGMYYRCKKCSKTKGRVLKKNLFS